VSRRVVPRPISGELERWSAGPGDTPNRVDTCSAASLTQRGAPANGYSQQAAESYEPPCSGQGSGSLDPGELANGEPGCTEGQRLTERNDAERFGVVACLRRGGV
jgi:hypothetical protein